MDFEVLRALQAINGLVGWYEESKASDAIEVTIGGLISAYCEVLDGKLIQVDTSQMTGESLCVTMRKGDKRPRLLC